MLNTVASISMQQQSHSMQNQTQHQTVHGTHTKSVKRTKVREVRACFSTKQQACITTSVYPLQETPTKKQVPASQKAPRGCKQDSTVGKGNPGV